MTGEWFRGLVEHAPDAICVLQHRRLVYVNATAVRLIGAETSDELIGRRMTDFVDPHRMPPEWPGPATPREAGAATDPVAARMVRLDGVTLRVEARCALTSWEGAPAHQVVLRDVSTRRARLFAVMDSLDEGVIVVRTDGRITLVNTAAMQIYGLGPESGAADFARRAKAVAIFDADGRPLPPELCPGNGIVECSRRVFGVDMPNGERKWLLTTARLLDPGTPAESDVLVSFSDITSEREDLDRLMYQANHDPLTGLPNRAFVLRRITEALAATDCGRLGAVLFIDLDDLKTTNDTLGHDAGDALLNVAATRLRQAVGPGDVVGRHGGDEFVALIFGGPTRGELDGLVDRLRVRLAEPVVIAETTVPIRASVGIVEVDRDDQRSAEEILRDADRAMYKAKREGRGHDRRRA